MGQLESFLFLAHGGAGVSTRIGDFKEGGIRVCGLHRLLCIALLYTALVVSSVTYTAHHMNNQFVHQQPAAVWK
jgi:hypothetical protein